MREFSNALVYVMGYFSITEQNAVTKRSKKEYNCLTNGFIRNAYKS